VHIFIGVFRFHDRIFTTNASLRRIIKRFALGGKKVNGKTIDVLTAEEKIFMLNESAKVCAALHEFLVYIDSDTITVAPDSTKDFLLCLASKSPVCSYVHVNDSVRQLITNLLAGVNIKGDPVAWNQLHEELPIIYKMLSPKSVTTVPQPLSKLLSVMWQKAEATFHACREIADTNEAIQTDQLSHFPCLPKLRNRCTFSADVRKNVSNTGACKKRYTGHPTLLPGIFTLYCQHGVCYGFQVMANHESPDVPFTIIRTRFTQGMYCTLMKTNFFPAAIR
jgi:hypothetical protein